MSILKDFMAEKRRSLVSGKAESSGQCALFFGVCRNINDVAWWSSLASEPDFSDFVSSCSSAIDASAAGGSRPFRNIDAPDLLRVTSVQTQGTIKRSTIASDMQQGFLAITLFCTGANQEQISAAKALAAPGVTVRPGRPRFDNIFRWAINRCL
jgi:hypothetical protein